MVDPHEKEASEGGRWGLGEPARLLHGEPSGRPPSARPRDDRGQPVRAVRKWNEPEGGAGRCPVGPTWTLRDVTGGRVGHAEGGEEGDFPSG